MTLRSITSDGLAGRLRRRFGGTPTADRSVSVAARIPISSMRALETSLALGAIATALLIGLGR